MGYSDGFNSVAQLFTLQNDRNRLKESRRQFDSGLAEKQRATNLANEQFYVSDNSANNRHTETIVGAKDRLTTQIAGNLALQNDSQAHSVATVNSEREYKKSQQNELQQAIYDVGDYYIKRTTAGSVEVTDKKTGKTKVSNDPELVSQINAIGSKQPVYTPPEKDTPMFGKSRLDIAKSAVAPYINGVKSSPQMFMAEKVYNGAMGAHKWLNSVPISQQPDQTKVGPQQPMSPRVLQEFNVAQNEAPQEPAQPAQPAETIPSPEERQAVARLAAMTGNPDLYTQQYAPNSMSPEAKQKAATTQYYQAKTMEAFTGIQNSILEQNDVSLEESQKTALNLLKFVKSNIGDFGVPKDDHGTRDLIISEVTRGGTALFGNNFASPEFFKTYGPTMVARAAKSRYLYPNTSAEGALMTEVRRASSGIDEDDIETWTELSSKVHIVLAEQLPQAELQQAMGSLYSSKRSNAEVLNIMKEIIKSKGNHSW